jgi:hypothetical protein
MDPRVKIPPEVQQIFTLTTKMEDHATNAATAYKQARELVEKLKARPQSAENDALIKKVEEIAPVEAAPSGGGRGGRGGGAAEPPAPPNLSNLAAQMVGAVQGMQAAEMAPTVLELQACAKAEATYTALMAKWNALKTPAPK